MEGGGGADRIRQRRLHQCVGILSCLCVCVAVDEWVAGWLVGLFPPPVNHLSTRQTGARKHTGYLKGRGVPVAWAKTGVKFVHHEAEKYDLGKWLVCLVGCSCGCSCWCVKSNGGRSFAINPPTAHPPDQKPNTQASTSRRTATGPSSSPMPSRARCWR